MNDKVIEIRKKSKKRIYILLGLSVIGIIILRLNFIFVFIGMLPAVVAYLIDHDPHKYTSSTVAALNFSGVFPYMVDIFMQGETIHSIQSKLSEPVAWLVMYGSAAIGWGIVMFSPMVAAAILESIYAGRIMHLESMQKKYVEEWGDEVAGNEKE